MRSGKVCNAPKGSAGDQVDFDAMEEEAEELLTLLMDRQPGMTAFYPLVAESVRRLGELAAPLLRQSEPPAE
jgi:hypothetical protein